MAKSRQQLKSYLAEKLTDFLNRQITPAVMRNVLAEIIDNTASLSDDGAASAVEFGNSDSIEFFKKLNDPAQYARLAPTFELGDKSTVAVWAPGPVKPDVFYYVDEADGPVGSGFYEPKAANLNSLTVTLADYFFRGGTLSNAKANLLNKLSAGIWCNEVIYTNIDEAIAASNGNQIVVNGTWTITVDTNRFLNFYHPPTFEREATIIINDGLIINGNALNVNNCYFGPSTVGNGSVVNGSGRFKARSVTGFNARIYGIMLDSVANGIGSASVTVAGISAVDYITGTGVVYLQGVSTVGTHNAAGIVVENRTGTNWQRFTGTSLQVPTSQSALPGTIYYDGVKALRHIGSGMTLTLAQWQAIPTAGNANWEVVFNGTGSGSTSPGGGTGSNTIPTASAGNDSVLTLPTNQVALIGSGSDADGTITGYAWRQVTGPNNAIGLPATTKDVVASGLVAGSYQFGFKTQDNSGAFSNEDFVVVAVNASTAPAPLLDVHGILAGNSLTFAGGTDLYSGEVEEMTQDKLAALGDTRTFTVSVVAAGGRTTQGLLDFAQAVVDAFVPGKRNVVQGWELFNQFRPPVLSLSVTDPALIQAALEEGFALFQQFCAYILAAKPGTEIICGTPINDGYWGIEQPAFTPRENFRQVIQLPVTNLVVTAKQNGTAKYSHIANYALDTAYDTREGLGFTSDGIHQTAAGNAILAARGSEAFIEVITGKAQEGPYLTAANPNLFSTAQSLAPFGVSQSLVYATAEDGTASGTAPLAGGTGYDDIRGQFGGHFAAGADFELLFRVLYSSGSNDGILGVASTPGLKTYPQMLYAFYTSDYQGSARVLRHIKDGAITVEDTVPLPDLCWAGIGRKTVNGVTTWYAFRNTSATNRVTKTMAGNYNGICYPVCAQATPSRIDWPQAIGYTV